MICIDDPIKPEDVFSAKLRNKANRKIINTVQSRKAKSSTPVVMIMQRLHVDDPIRLTEDGSLTGKWRRIVVPALIDDDYINTLPPHIAELVPTDVPRDSKGRQSYWNEKESLKSLLEMEQGGTNKDSQAISVPSDIVVADEFSYANATVVKQYQSRLNHSKYKEKIYFSTPTLPGRGISALFDESKQHFRMVKCTHCGHWSWPNLPHDIRIPGVPEIDWSTLNKAKLAKLDYMSAFFACPKCGKAPDYSHEHREWVCKNPDDKYEAVGYAVSPCDVPAYRKASDLVMERTEYARYVDFMNTGCGLPYEDLESTYTYEELAACFISEKGGSNMMRVMGLDMGLECACTIWAVNYDGLMILEHAEMIPIGRLDERRGELTRQYRVSLTVADALPYTDTIMRMQVYDPNLWAAVYTRSKNAETHTLKRYEEKPEEGRELVRQVNINRDPAFDAMMGHVRSGLIKFAVPEMKETIIAHFMDMTRERQYTSENEMRYTWVKSAKGEDHLIHSSLFAFIGARMRGTAVGVITLPTASIFTFKNKALT